MGNAMEWFDFGIYSYLVVIISQVFYSGIDESYQLIFGFGTFAVAFLVRPIGGVVFGRLGDKLGRKKILALTLIMMAIATLSIGFIPSYESIGIWAPILLLLARLVQGFSTGGEYSGAMTFIAESAPDKRRGLMASGLEVGTLVGYIAGSGVVTLLTYMLGDQTMLDWGWRIPFFIAGPIGIIGLYLRNHLEESPAFAKMEEQKEEAEAEAASASVSLKDMLIYHRKPLIIAIILVFFYNVIDYTVLTYMPSHLSDVLGYGNTKGLLLILIVMFIMIPIVLIMGHFGDRIGNKRIIIGSLIGVVVLSVPAFMLIETGSNLLVFFGLLIIAVLLSALQGTMPSQLPSLFFTEVRYSGLSITYNVSASLFGGTAPLLIAWLINVTASTFAPAFYLVFAAIIGIIVVSIYVENTSGKPLRGDAPAVAEEGEIIEAIEDSEALWWKEEKQEIEERMEEDNNTDDKES
ncbi:MAG TPA: MFS transporter [Candidatus Avamphibacillus intestinigallinarum]|nr:MFS transporter [Candidatus Avamphibacillus intestinigallinarum]